MSVLTKHRFSTKDYYRMAETGVLGPETRVELLDGEIIDMSPIGPSHGAVTKRLNAHFTQCSNDRWLVAVQDPVHLDDHSEPQPDLMLLERTPDFYATKHPRPADVLLLVEVADTSLAYDRDRKLPAYAAAGIPEVWIVNLGERTIEVYREPSKTGFRWSTILRVTDRISPMNFRDAEVAVKELLGS